MTLRTRLQASIALLAVVSVGGLAAAVRYDMTRRLTAQYEQRVASLLTVIRTDLTRERDAIGSRLSALGAALKDDNSFRLALTPAGDKRSAIDYAGRAMPQAGLAMLTITDVNGRVLSSGQFRNEFDRVDSVPRLVAAAANALTLTQVRTAEGPFLALAGVDSVRLGAGWLMLAGGVRVDRDYLKRLARDANLVVSLEYPGGSLSSADSGAVPVHAGVTDTLALAFVTAAPVAQVAAARLVVTQSLAPLIALQNGIARWSLFAGVVAALWATILGAALAAKLSGPLSDLAEETAALDLDTLDANFTSSRTDEVGTLARTLGALTDRLRRGARLLREAERRATVGDLARQVNHDVKNGLVPIRNVLRHLAEVLEQRPADLPAVLRERKSTLDAGVEYLETLAANYARLTPQLDAGSADVQSVVAEVIAAARPDVKVEHSVAADLPPTRGDRVVLRRILENVVGNAADSVAGHGGLVTVTVEAATAPSAGVRIVVQDTGPGMTPEQLERAFEDFYTTKPGGTGLGLSIVRRLVNDLEGSLNVATAPGNGTRVEIVLPTALLPSRLATP